VLIFPNFLLIYLFIAWFYPFPIGEYSKTRRLIPISTLYCPFIIHENRL